MAKAVARRGIQTTSWRTILLLVETGLSDINLNSTPEGAGCKEEIPRAGVLGMGMGMGIGNRESVVWKRENSINTNSEYEREALRYWKWGNVPEKTRNEFHAKDATIAKKGSSILCFYW
jgi:hypothetical protein